MYRTEAECSEVLGTFLRDAAASAEPVLVALPSERLDPVRDAVRDAVATDPGQSRFEDMRVVGRNPNRLLPMIEDWVRGHEGPTRVVSEAIFPGRSYPEIAECLRHEALLNAALADAPATILCPFDASNLDATTLAGVELTHPTVVEGGARRPSGAYSGSAELDLDTRWPLEPPTDPVDEIDLGTLWDLRRAVAGDPIVGSLSRDRRADLVLAVNEAATNAVRHSDGTYRTRIWHDGRGVVTELRAEHGLTDRRPLHGPRPASEAESGRGLWLINQVCDLVEFRADDQGSILRLHMDDEVSSG